MNQNNQSNTIIITINIVYIVVVIYLRRRRIKMRKNNKMIDYRPLLAIGYTPKDVYEYAGEGDVQVLQLALNCGNNSFNWYKNENNSTALHFASQEGHIGCIDLLLDTGAEIEIKNNDGCTALHMAAFHGTNEGINALLDRNANIESKQNQGYTALNFASQECHIQCIDVLCDRGADIESKNRDGATPLQSAAYQGHVDCIHALLERGADIDSLDNHGETALHLAAQEGHVDCMHALLERGADIDSLDYHGETAVLVAAHNKQIECTRFLLNRGAMVDESMIDDIKHRKCRQMIREEIQHRLRRAAFDSFINNHIEYPPLIHGIYSTCYPSGDLRVASPAIGWDRAEAVRNKYYFDEVLFYVHVYVANELAKKAMLSQKLTRASSRRYSIIQGYLATNSDDTWTLMTVLSDRLKMYLKPV